MKKTILSIAGLAFSAGVAGAQAVTVTPSNMQGWQSVGDAPAQITTAYPRSGAGSLELTLADGASQIAEERILFGTTHNLSNLSALSYDWYVSSTSTMPDYFMPAFGLRINDATYGDGYLVYERAYNAPGAAPKDAWQHDDILNGKFWYSNSAGTAAPGCGYSESYQTINWFMTNCLAAGDQVNGLAVFMGDAVTGTFDAAVDNVSIGFNNTRNVDPTTYNFEPDITTTPEPSSMALIGTGLFGLVPMIRRRKR